MIFCCVLRFALFRLFRKIWRVTNVLASPRIVELAIGQLPCTGSDHRATKLQR